MAQNDASPTGDVSKRDQKFAKNGETGTVERQKKQSEELKPSDEKL